MLQLGAGHVDSLTTTERSTSFQYTPITSPADSRYRERYSTLKLAVMLAARIAFVPTTVLFGNTECITRIWKILTFNSLRVHEVSPAIVRG